MTHAVAIAISFLISSAALCLASDFPPLNEAVKWLESERLRGTLFHEPRFEPMFKRFIKPSGITTKEQLAVEVVGETYIAIMPDDGKVSVSIKAVRGADVFPNTIYALFDDAGNEIATGIVKLGKSTTLRVSRQKGVCTLLINSGPASRNVARISSSNRCWAIDAREHSAYDRTPIHLHFLRDLKLCGFNCVMVDFERLEDAFETDDGLASWRNKVKQWTDYARKVRLRIIPAINLGGSPAEVRAWGDVRRGLYIEHKEGLPLAPCPLSKEYWERIYLRRAREVAKLSLENPFIVGIGLDPEMYQCWIYGHYMLSGTCFCDSCLGGFLRAKGLSEDVLGKLHTGKERYDWLMTNKLYSDYEEYLEDEMAKIAQWCRDEVHSINPNLLLNMFVIEIGNWFCRGIARGFGKAGVPALNFCEHTYYGVGYDPKWLERIIKAFKDWGAYVVQGSAVWGLYFPPTDQRFLAAHCYNLAVKGQGYWFWPGDDLYRDWGCRFAYLNRPAYWDEYWTALALANKEIEQTIANPNRTSILDAWEPVPWRGKLNSRTGKWDVDESIVRPQRERAYPVTIVSPTRLYFHMPREGQIAIAAKVRSDGVAQLALAPKGGETIARTMVTSKEEAKIELENLKPGIWQLAIEQPSSGQFAEVGLAMGGLIEDAYLATSPQALPLYITKPKGLIGHWSFDEGKGTVAHDKSEPPQFDGTVVGAQWVDGVSGSAIKFDGSSGSVEVRVNFEFHCLSEFTISAFVRLDDLPTKGNGATMLNKGPEAPVQHVWWWIGYPPDYPLILELGNEKHRWGTSFSTKPLKWDIGRWYHVAVTFKRRGDQCIVRHYRDGELVGEVTKVDELHSGTYNLRIGSYGGLHWINGAIDEVKFYNVALGDEEIRNEAALIKGRK